MKIAVIGGWHVHTLEYATAIRNNPKAELACLWDDDPARGQDLAQKLGIPFQPFFFLSAPFMASPHGEAVERSETDEVVLVPAVQPSSTIAVAMVPAVGLANCIPQRGKAL